MEGTKETQGATGTEEREKSATDIYTRFTLSLYDWWVLGVTSRFVFKCPKSHFVEFYNRHVTGNHLDVGVGSGYFLDKCRFPTPSPRIGLMDINPNCLQYVKQRLRRYAVETYQADVLGPIDGAIRPFDSIGFSGVFHALPGSMEEKCAVFDNLNKLLAPGGTLFGCTILYRDVEVGPMARKLTEIYNRKRILLNLEDRLPVLEAELKKRYRESAVETRGAFALFHARR